MPVFTLTLNSKEYGMKKLKLHRETLRALTSTEMSQVRGGLPPGWTGPIDGTAVCCAQNTIKLCIGDGTTGCMTFNGCDSNTNTYMTDCTL